MTDTKPKNPSNPGESASKNQSSKNQPTMKKISEEDMLSLDNELAELRQKYTEAKKSREIVAENEKNIQSKMKLLSHKEIEAEKKLELRTKNHKDMEDIMEYSRQQKQRMQDLKKDREEKLKVKREQVKEQRNKIIVSLSEWRDKNTQKNKGEGNKKLSEKRDLEKAVQLGKEKIINKKKYSHDQIKMSFIQKEQQKKAEEMEKKLKRKKELEELINKELNRKKELQESIDNFNAESVKINEKIKEMDKRSEEQLAESRKMNKSGSAMKNNP